MHSKILYQILLKITYKKNEINILQEKILLQGLHIYKLIYVKVTYVK